MAVFQLPAAPRAGSTVVAVHPFDAHQLGGWFQALMLTCFSLAWPMANLRLWRLRHQRREAQRVIRSGRGRGFTRMVLCGYAAGVATQLAWAAQGQALDGMFWFYLVNAASVGLNLRLQALAERRPSSPGAVQGLRRSGFSLRTRRST